MPSEAAIERAHHLITQLLPTITSHDMAMDHLYYLTPDATPASRLWSIAAALYILREAGEPR